MGTSRRQSTTPVGSASPDTNKATLVQRGFTIVELMIVIVVIAILAAITAVSYNGVMDRAHDSAVQQDLREFGVQLELFRAARGAYPLRSQLPNEFVAEVGRVRVSANSYDLRTGMTHTGDSANFLYCNGGEKFALVALSRSGTLWQYGGIGAGEYTGQENVGSIGMCADAGAEISGVDYRDYLWGHGSNQWRDYIEA